MHSLFVNHMVMSLSCGTAVECHPCAGVCALCGGGQQAWGARLWAGRGFWPPPLTRAAVSWIRLEPSASSAVVGLPAHSASAALVAASRALGLGAASRPGAAKAVVEVGAAVQMARSSRNAASLRGAVAAMMRASASAGMGVRQGGLWELIQADGWRIEHFFSAR